jgi:hypothetical protein
LSPIQIPRPTTRACPTAQPELSATRGDATLPTEDPIARTLNTMAEVMEHVTGNEILSLAILWEAKYGTGSRELDKLDREHFCRVKLLGFVKGAVRSF